MTKTTHDFDQRYKGILCIPFTNPLRPSGEDDLLERLENWVLSAASKANIELVPVRDSFDSASEIMSRVYRTIQDADIIVSVVQGNNPNVFFESGYAAGWDKSILYVSKEGEPVPFDIGNVERFVYRQLDDKDGLRLTAAMKQCIRSTSIGLAGSIHFVRFRQHLLSTAFSDDLFGRCISHTFDGIMTWVRSWSGNSNFEFLGAHSILEIGTFILRNIRNGGFVTLYYPGQESWEADTDNNTPDEYFEATREAVKRRCAITRVYVVEDLPQINEEGFRRMVREDVAAGIEAKYILRIHLPDHRASDFGLWDDELYCEVEYTGTSDQRPRLHRCRYWSDEYHLAQGRAWKEEIAKNAQPCPDLPSEQSLLLESVRNSCEALIPFCRSTENGKADCSAYHIHWQTLRQHSMVSTPSWHADFYTAAFRNWSALNGKSDATGPLSILICGLADYAMLYWVAQSLDSSVRDRSIFHVLDICNTPLQGCKWLQKKLRNSSPPINLNIRLHHTSLFDNSLDAASFDLITTDAFLTRFDTMELKRAVVSEWLRLLRIGGRIVTTARVQESTTDIQALDRNAFVVRIIERAGQNEASIHELRKAAQDYADYIQSFPFKSEDELRLFLHTLDPQIHVCALKCQSLIDFEMTPATYARIEIERTL